MKQKKTNREKAFSVVKEFLLDRLDEEDYGLETRALMELVDVMRFKLEQEKKGNK